MSETVMRAIDGLSSKDAFLILSLEDVCKSFWFELDEDFVLKIDCIDGELFIAVLPTDEARECRDQMLKEGWVIEKGNI